MDRPVEAGVDDDIDTAAKKGSLPSALKSSRVSLEETCTTKTRKSVTWSNAEHTDKAEVDDYTKTVAKKGSLLSALKSNPVSLKETCTTKTRKVVTSEGNVIWEQVNEVRGPDGIFTEVVGTEKRVGKPSFAAETLNGSSDLVPRVFDPLSDRWINSVPLPGAPTKSFNGGKLRILTFNTWFADVHFEERAQGLIDLIIDLNAHIVNLQEVTPRLLEILKKTPFIRSKYFLSDSVGSTLSPYGVIMPTCRQMNVASLKLHHVPTSMARRYVAGEILCDSDSVIHVGTIHMESLDYNAPTRIKQIQSIFGSTLPGLEAKAPSATTDHVGIVKNSNACAAIVTGDFNFDPRNDEEQHIPADVHDVWVQEGVALADDTGFTSPSGTERIDRVMLYNAHQLHDSGPKKAMQIKATEIRRVGDEHISGK